MWDISFPRSLLFYPAIGFVVEILFHVLPLAIFFLLLASLFRKRREQTMMWLGILLVSAVEPLYQTIGFIGAYHAWTVGYVGLHVFFFNVLQLTIFKRYDFVSLYAFWLGYYLLWHMVWGVCAITGTFLSLPFNQQQGEGEEG